MEFIEKVLNTKPTDETGNAVYATNAGWCVKQKFQAKQEEVVYEYRSLLNILQEHGYDMYGEAVTDGAGSASETGGETDDGHSNPDSEIDDGSAVTTELDGGDDSDACEGDDSDSAGDTEDDAGSVESTETETETGTDDGVSDDDDVVETADDSAGSESVKYTEESLNALPDMKALREVAQKFDVNDISKAKLIAKILKAQDA